VPETERQKEREKGVTGIGKGRGRATRKPGSNGHRQNPKKRSAINKTNILITQVIFHDFLTPGHCRRPNLKQPGATVVPSGFANLPGSESKRRRRESQLAPRSTSPYGSAEARTPRGLVDPLEPIRGLGSRRRLTPFAASLAPNPGALELAFRSRTSPGIWQHLARVLSTPSDDNDCCWWRPGG